MLEIDLANGPRRSPSTVSYNKWLVVAGGIDNASHNVAVVENEGVICINMR